MSSIVIAGNASGGVTISAPADAGSPILTLPTVSGTIALTSDVLGIGTGQTWQAFTVGINRLNNTNYTNSTTKPIMVNILVNDPGAAQSNAYVDGIFVAFNYGNSTGGYSGSTLSFIVPIGSTYKVVATSGLSQWAELR